MFILAQNGIDAVQMERLLMFSVEPLEQEWAVLAYEPGVDSRIHLGKYRTGEAALAAFYELLKEIDTNHAGTIITMPPDELSDSEIKDKLTYFATTRGWSVEKMAQDQTPPDEIKREDIEGARCQS